MSEQSSSKAAAASSGEINAVQNAIESITKKIEHEKINLRLAKERYQKQLDTLLKLQGKNIPVKEKRDASLPRLRRSVMEYDKPDKQKQLKNQEFLRVEIEKNKATLDTITDEINLIILKNKDTRKKIEELRKEKIGSMYMMNTLRTKKTLTTRMLEELEITNDRLEKEEDGIISIKALI
jgi:hypothetical protein